VTPPHRLLAELDRWAQFGLPILITEYDITVPDLALQADFTRDFLTVCFSHPQVQGVVTWGFWSGAMWRPESALFGPNWQPTPLGKQWIALQKQWTTDEQLVSDAEGRGELQGYLGDYLVSHESGQARVAHKSAEGTATEVRID